MNVFRRISISRRASPTRGVQWIQTPFGCRWDWPHPTLTAGSRRRKTVRSRINSYSCSNCNIFPFLKSCLELIRFTWPAKDRLGQFLSRLMLWWVPAFRDTREKSTHCLTEMLSAPWPWAIQQNMSIPVERAVSKSGISASLAVKLLSQYWIACRETITSDL